MLMRDGCFVGRTLLTNSLLFLLISFSSSLQAGELHRVSVDKEQDQYHIEVDVSVSIPLSYARDYLTDYERLYRVNDAIEESRILQVLSSSVHRVYTRTNACILFFCLNLISVQDITQHDDKHLSAHILPEPSMFDKGEITLTMSQVGNVTRLKFIADIVPKFWVPPIIGEWIIAWKLKGESLESMYNMEALFALEQKQ